MKYRKKPVVIEAEPVRDIIRAAATNWRGLPAWVRDAYDGGKILVMPQSVTISTLEGAMTGEIGDFIIQGVKGEIYPCKPDIFEATYEAVP